MSDWGIGVSPYYDRYDGDSQHRKNGYTMVLAKPGLAEQASEFNEAQSIQRDYLERLGNAILRDGNIVSGCELNIQGKSVTVEPGRLFLEGLVREFDGDTLQITAVGLERIVASVKTSIVTENDDMSLRDPAQGADNYGMAGAHRIKQVVKLRVVGENDSEDGSGTTIYELRDGELLKDETSNDFSFITDTLAERTYDENGNFKIWGLNIRSLVEGDGEGDNFRVKAYVTEGKAYVRGYEVSKSSMTTVMLRAATDTRFVQSESHYYSSTVSKYELSNGPVARVQNLTCLVACTGERKYRGNIAGGYDSLNNTPVDSITRVYTMDSGGRIDKIYVPGKDYKLYNDQVDWSLVGDEAEEPAKGSSYYVDYVYNKSMGIGVDYDVENTESTAYIKFLDNGAKPDDNSRMYISYEYTLARRDLLLLDSDGAVSVIEGVPEKMGNLLTPFNGSTAYLELGYIDIYPWDKLNNKPSNSNYAKVRNYYSVRMTQDDLYNMLQRVEQLEENISELDLEREIEEGESSTELKGYFVDNFQSADKSDLAYSEEQSDGSVIRYTASIDIDRGEITTAADIKSTELLIDDKTSDDYATYGTIISAPYEYELELQQKYATGTMKVNPYAAYGPMCQITINPSIDNWIDENKVVVYNTLEEKAYTTSSRTFHHWYAGYNNRETKTSTSYEGSTTSTRTSASAVSKTAYEFMRQRRVDVVGKAFSNGMKNIYGTFNEIPIDLIADSGTTQGADKDIDGKSYKTVNASENGSFNCHFTVPENVPCGSAEVKLSALDDEGDEYSGTTVYKASGSLMNVTITNTTVITQRYKVLNEIHNYYVADPLAQTFIMSDRYDRNLMKLGLYFAKKSSTRPVIVQIRNVVNGYPGETVYAEVSIDSRDVNIPTDPNVPVVTEVVLNQPVYCYAGVFYCFVVLSDSNSYEMYYAEMGKTLLGKTEQLVINPYSTGVMFSSSNANTWTAHQGSDLKFELYRSRFTGSGEIIFDDVKVDSNEITGLLLDAAYEDNNNSGLLWFYRYALSSTENSDWLPIDTLVYRDLQGETNKITLKAQISTDFSTSPYIDAGRVSLRSFIDDKEAVYISKHLTKEDFDEEYQSLKISYQAAMPTGASHKVYYQDTMYGDWIELVEDVGDDPNISLELKTVDEEFVQYTWTIKKVDCMIKNPESYGSRFFKMRIDLNTTLRYNRPRIKRLTAIFKYNY